MSHFDYEQSKRLAEADPSFYALVMAAMRKADSTNIAKLRSVFPAIWAELDARYNAPGGILPTDPGTPAELADWQDLMGASITARVPRGES